MQYYKSKNHGFLLVSFFLFAWCHCYISANAQPKNLELISVAGQNFSNSYIEASFSVGDISVETFANNDLILCQGFQQNYTSEVGINQLASEKGFVLIYPNLTNGMVYFNIKPNNIFQNDLNFEIEIVSIQGQCLTKKSFNGCYYSIDLASFSEGTYIVKISHSLTGYHFSQIVQRVN